MRDRLQKVLSGLRAIEDALAQTHATGSQDTAPSKLDSQFVGLYGRVIAHEGRPTEPERSRLRDIDPLLTAQQSTLDALIRTELPQLNDVLKKHGLSPIQVPVAR